MKSLLFLQPTTSDEVETLIDGLNNNKAIRTIDEETKFITLSKNILSSVLNDLFNACIAQGKFPDCLKIAEVISIIKNKESQFIHKLPTNFYSIANW